MSFIEVDYDKLPIVLKQEVDKSFMFMNEYCWQFYEKKNGRFINVKHLYKPDYGIWVKVREGTNGRLYFDYYKGSVDLVDKWYLLYETERNKFIFDELLRAKNVKDSSDMLSKEDYQKWVNIDLDDEI